jgi:hypothetical protein
MTDGVSTLVCIHLGPRMRVRAAEADPKTGTACDGRVCINKYMCDLWRHLYDHCRTCECVAVRREVPHSPSCMNFS